MPRMLFLFIFALSTVLFMNTARADFMKQVEELDKTRETPRSLLFGINMVSDGELLGMPEGYEDDVYVVLNRLGANFVRLLASMREVEKVRGQRDWTEFDAKVDQALAHGMEPMMLICNTPLWALPPTPGLPEGMDPTYQYPYDPKFYAEWEDFCHDLGERTRGKIKLYQLWNEQNGCSWHFHDGYNHTDEYMPFLEVAYRGLKKGNPDAALLLGSLDDADGHAHIYLNQAYEIRDNEYGGRRMFDGVTLHPYDYDIAKKEQKLRRIHEIMKANGDGDLPLYITEYGWRTGDERDGDKQRALRETLELYQKPDLGFLKGAIQLCLTDFSGEPGFGLTDENFRPRESFYVHQGTPRFGASPPHHIEWMPVRDGVVEISWRTQLPTRGTVRYYRKGAAAEAAASDMAGEGFIRWTEPGTEHSLQIGHLEPGAVYEFTIETRTVEEDKVYNSHPHPIYVPGPMVANGDFNDGFFGGIAEGWRIERDGLCTDAEVWGGIEVPEGEHAQVVFGLPKRPIRLDSTASTWIATRSGEPLQLSVEVAKASLHNDSNVRARVGIDPSGGMDKNAEGIVWSDWRNLESDWQTLLTSATAKHSLATVYVQIHSDMSDEEGAPAGAFDNVRVTRSDRRAMAE